MAVGAAQFCVTEMIPSGVANWDKEDTMTMSRLGERLRIRAGTAAFGFAALFMTVVPAHADPYSVTAGSDLIGGARTHTAVADDTLIKVAETHRLRVADVIAANPGIDPWLPGANVVLVLPTIHILPDSPREDLVINLPEQRVYQYLPDDRVRLFPFSIGHDGCRFQVGEANVKKRRRKPSWRPPADVRARRPDLPEVVPPGPRNPLGEYALDLALPGRIIHGAARPFSGRADGTGCVQVYPEDAKNLYLSSAPGMKVRVVNQPVKFGWSAGELFMEAHPTQDQAGEAALGGSSAPVKLTDLNELLEKAAGDEVSRVDRSLVRKTARESRGVPVRITRDRTPPKSKKVRGLFGD